MSRRNFILLVIILILIATYLFWFFYLRPTPNINNGGDVGGFFSNLNPFGKTTVVTPPTKTNTGGDNGENPSTNPNTEANKLLKVSTMPIAGYTPFEKEKVAGEFHPALRYVDRATGNIYQTFADDVKERKFSSTVIPKIYEALFANDGNTVLMRYLKEDNKTIQTFIGNLPKELLGDDSIITNDVQGTFLPDNISDISISPDKTKVFYLLNGQDNVVGIILNLKDSKKTQVFDSPFTEWLSNWLGNKSIALTTKASAIAPGYTYLIDPTKKVPSRIVGNINGLTTLASPDGKNLLFTDNNLSLSIYNISSRTTTTLGVNTESEKCVWDSVGVTIYCAVPKNKSNLSYPDSWYQGETSFDDQIWKIDTTTNNTTVLVDPGETVGENIDATKLMLDAKENYLFFVNKKDSFLWEFNLN